MELFNNIASNIDSLDLWETLVPILKKKDDRIVALNQDQLSKSLGSDGSQLGDYRSDAYVSLKQREVPTYKLNGEVDLRFKGNFYKDMYADFDNNGATVGSTDIKEERLQSKYGDKIFGLTEQNIDVLMDESLIDEFADTVLNNILKD